MKQTEGDIREIDRVLQNTESKIRGYVQEIEEQTERVDEEKAALKAIMERADAEGFNSTMLKQVVADKKRTKDEIKAQEAELALYRKAIGLDL